MKAIHAESHATAEAQLHLLTEVELVGTNGAVELVMSLVTEDLLERRILGVDGSTLVQECMLVPCRHVTGHRWQVRVQPFVEDDVTTLMGNYSRRITRAPDQVPLSRSLLL